MANELGQVTVNADGDSWVDNIPGSVSSGYQAQNTSSESVRVGIDKIIVEYDSEAWIATFKVSGPIDVNGILFSVKEEFSIGASSNNTPTYFVVRDGVDQNSKSIVTATSAISFDPNKNAYYLDVTGERVLNTCLSKENELSSLVHINQSGQAFLNALYVPTESVRWVDSIYLGWRGTPSTYGSYWFFGGAPVNSINYCSVIIENRIKFCNHYEITGEQYIWEGNIDDGDMKAGTFIVLGANYDCVGIAAYDSQDVIKLITASESNNRIDFWSGDAIGSTIESSFSPPGDSVRGIVVVDGDLYSLNKSNNSLYKHDGLSSTASLLFEVPGVPGKPWAGDVADITYDGNNFIISVNTSNDDIVKFLYLVVSPEGSLVAKIPASLGDNRAISVNYLDGASRNKYPELSLFTVSESWVCTRHL